MEHSVSLTFRKPCERGQSRVKTSFISFYSVLKCRRSSEAGPKPSSVCPSPHYSGSMRFIPAGCSISRFALLQGQAKAIHHCAPPPGPQQGSENILWMLECKSQPFRGCKYPFFSPQNTSAASFTLNNWDQILLLPHKF